jgi:diguanylate cyclase (GGDEF)-like protein
MKPVKTIEDVGSDSDIILKVQTAQIQQLFQQTWMGMIGVLVVTMSVCFVQWPVIPHWKLMWWGGLSLLLSLARGILANAFQRKSPSGTKVLRWGRWQAVGVSASGVLWAVPSIWMWTEQYPVHLLVWPICIVALSAAAVAAYCTWTPSYMAYPLLAVVPVSLRMILEGGTVYPVVGMLGFFFVAFLLHTGKAMHDATRKALVVGIRNEALSDFLSKERAKQEILTRKLQAAHDKLRQLSLTDELTGLWNRRYFNATIPELLLQSTHPRRRSDDGISEPGNGDIGLFFIMVDLDHFKEVNDTYGHSAGDKVLQQMTILLYKSCREKDTIVRWGGEEFLVIARDLKSSTYGGLLERIRYAVECHRFDIGQKTPISITCSIGASAFPPLIDRPESFNWKTIVDIADFCLYSAKRSARNAWVGVHPTPLTSAEEFTPDLSSRIPEFINQGKMELNSSLPSHKPIQWAE